MWIEAVTIIGRFVEHEIIEDATGDRRYVVNPCNARLELIEEIATVIDRRYSEGWRAVIAATFLGQSDDC